MIRRQDVVLAATPTPNSGPDHEGVAQLIRVQFLNAEDMSLPTIRADFSGQLPHSKHNNAAATHDWEVSCSAGGHPKSAIIRAETSL